MPLRSLFRPARVASLVLLLIQGTAVAYAAEQPAVEARAVEILNAALAHLAGTPSLKLRSEVISEVVLPSGQKLQHPGVLELALRRPDRLWYRLESELRRVTAWYDGKTFTLLDSDKNVCASTSAPQGLGPLFDDMSSKLGFRPPLSVLLREDNASVVLKRVTSGFYAGRGVIGGIDCHHLAFKQQTVDLEFWVAAEGAPLIKRVVITQKQLPAMPQLSYTIVGWEPGAVLDDELFRFTPPVNVVRCDFQSLVK